MLISSITLDNIRSYIHQKIDFQEGINVLYGNIGSGKSTILLAIEVALFGLKKGDGHHILRKGCDEGSIEVIFKEGDTIFTVQRTFKKSKAGITQSKGIIKYDSQILELSTQEMNMQIFTYFNFPISFLNKDKTLMYRFTHYTPQEQLKEILLTQADKRLEVLRKVFNIDKYKQLQQALQLASKSTSKELIVLRTKLDELPKNLVEGIGIKTTKIQELEAQLKEFELKEKSLKIKLQTIMKNKRILEDKKATINHQVKQIQAIEEDIKLNEENTKIQKQLQRQLQDKIKEVSSKLNELKEKVLKREILEKEIIFNEEKILEIQKKSKEIDELLLQIEKEEFEFEKFKTEIKKLNGLEMKYTQIEAIIKDNELHVKKQESNTKKEEKITQELKIIQEELYSFDVLLSQKKTSLLEFKEQIVILEKSLLASNLEDSKKVTCPTCFQKIDKNHLHHLKDSIQVKEKEISELEKNEKFLNLYDMKGKLESKLKLLELSNSQLLKLQVQIETYKQQLEEISGNIITQKNRFETLYSQEEINKFKEKLSDETQSNALNTFNNTNNNTNNTNNNSQLELKEKQIKYKEELYNLESRLKKYKLEFSQIKELEQEIQDLEIQLVKLTSKLHESENKERLFEDSIKQLQHNLKDLDTQVSLHSKINERISEQSEFEKKCNFRLEELFTQKSMCNTSKEYELKEKKVLELQILKSKDLSHKIQELEFQNSFVKEDMIEICRIVEETLFIEIHTELSRKIVHYFKQLIDEQEIEVYIREDFSIIIEQNGYEVDVEQLSGGEKSALALSYRLSLKEVIEAHFRDENSLKYIILDEPTDGFSQNQIQKFAQILRQSNFKQIFLVSHDSNLLTSGEHIYTIEKENHTSSIIKEG